MMPVACLRWWFWLGAGMLYASWECQGTNPGKLARLPALGLVTLGDALMGCLLQTRIYATVVDKNATDVDKRI